MIETIAISIVIGLAVYLSVQHRVLAGILMLSPLLAYRILKHRKIKQNEKASHMAMQAVIDNIHHSIWAIDRKFKLTVCNEKFRENLKANYNLDIKATPKATLNKSEREFWKKKYDQCFEGRTLTFDKSYANGASYQYWMYPMMLNGEITGVMAISIEITENLKHQEELVALNKQMAEYKLTALNAVMNPHFMFNSMNSIQYYMAKNERKMAMDSLSLFSRFIRKILDSASANRISLKAELEILHNYIKLEQIRFAEKFNFSIHIDPMIDTEAIVLPSLLIQPYVEHAIMNCLLNSEGQGQMAINIIPNGSSLLIVIEDNGVEQKQDKEPSILFTGDNLEKLNKNNNASVHMMKLKNNEGQLLGTRVSITINL